MKIYAIKNELCKDELGYLLYFEKEKEFHIEINEKAKYNNWPFIFDYFIQKKEYSINSYWSYIWVKDRIVPKERQNITQILKENNLEEYDEYKLLTISNGRCAQDEDYIEEKKVIPDLIIKRNKYHISEVIPLKGYILIIIFNNGKIKRYKIKDIINKKEHLEILMNNNEYFKNVRIKAHGFEIGWGDNILLTSTYLYSKGEEIALTKDELQHIFSSIIINTSEACEILNCSRQNIDDLVKRKKLVPLKESPKSKLFFKDDVIKRCK